MRGKALRVRLPKGFGGRGASPSSGLRVRAGWVLRWCPRTFEGNSNYEAHLRKTSVGSRPRGFTSAGRSGFARRQQARQPSQSQASALDENGKQESPSRPPAYIPSSYPPSRTPVRAGSAGAVLHHPLHPGDPADWAPWRRGD